MIEKIKTALFYGVVWLFLFSIPVGQGKHLFNLAWFYIVDTAPVNWVVNAVTGGIEAGSETAKRTADEIVGKMDSQLTKNEQINEAVE